MVRKEVIQVGRYKKYYSYENLNPFFIPPMDAKKSTIVDTRTGRKATGLDWTSYKEADRKAWETIHKNGKKRDC